MGVASDWVEIALVGRGPGMWVPITRNVTWEMSAFSIHVWVLDLCTFDWWLAGVFYQCDWFIIVT